MSTVSTAKALLHSSTIANPHLANAEGTVLPALNKGAIDSQEEDELAQYAKCMFVFNLGSPPININQSGSRRDL
jgi:hypothetical protein